MPAERKIWHRLVLRVLSLIRGIGDNEHLTSTMLLSVIFIPTGVYIINEPVFLRNRTDILK